jgi:hypothetical protein
MSEITLKQAIDKNKMDEFISQNKDKIGDKDKFDSTLQSMFNNSKSARQTSSEDSSEN